MPAKSGFIYFMLDCKQRAEEKRLKFRSISEAARFSWKIWKEMSSVNRETYCLLSRKKSEHSVAGLSNRRNETNLTNNDHLANERVLSKQLYIMEWLKSTMACRGFMPSSIEGTSQAKPTKRVALSCITNLLPNRSLAKIMKQSPTASTDDSSSSPRTPTSSVAATCVPRTPRAPSDLKKTPKYYIQ